MKSTHVCQFLPASMSDFVAIEPGSPPLAASASSEFSSARFPAYAFPKSG